VGIVLITVSGIAWRLTSTDAPSCRAMLGLTPYTECGDARFLSRPPAAVYGPPRTAHPYSGMMYSEFQYRPPPPSYQASMQEYRLRLLLMDRNAPPPPPPPPSGAVLLSPPPAYRGPRPDFLAPVHGGDVSRPPSYRSRASDHHHHLAVMHGRHPSQLSYLSQVLTEEQEPKEGLEQQQHASVVPVIPSAPLLHKASIRIESSGGEKKKEPQQHYISNLQEQFQRVDDGLTADAKKTKKELAAVLTTSRPVGSSSDRVTIVQNNPGPGGHHHHYQQQSYPLAAGRPGPFCGRDIGRSGSGGVVVTVSGGVSTLCDTSSQRSSPEVDILAHL
jgi:hypothetical protein